MTTLNHALWGATLGRVVKMPVEGAIFGALPDLIILPAQGYYLLKDKKMPHQAPLWTRKIYIILHNWWFALGLSWFLYIFSWRLSVASLAFFLHNFEDAFVHTDMATRFLYPVWEVKIQKLTAMKQHWWLQLIDLGLIILVNLGLNFLHIGW